MAALEVREGELVAAPVNGASGDPGPKAFLEALAAALRERNVRYCVLHDWEGLPEHLRSDLDTAVHPDDTTTMGAALRDGEVLGYRLVQCLPYAPEAYYLVFLNARRDAGRAVCIDVITAHWRKGVRVHSGEAMAQGARIHRGFRVPAPAVEFRYLTAKRVLKGGAPDGKGRRIASLLRELGPAEAQKATADIFGKDAAWLVRAAGEDLDRQARVLRRRLLWRNAWRRPADLISFWRRDAVRRVRRWLKPAGLLVAVTGPDGVGKSTFIENLVDRVAPAFRRVHRYHWRPGLLGSVRAGGSSVNPHGAEADPKWLSVFRLLWIVLDYQAARLQLRWQRARSGLVVFDRYYHDILVDPRRYRYGGPAWLARMLAPLVPQPDVLLVLHAPAAVVAARKQELDEPELRRQLKRYPALAKAANGWVIDAAGSPEDVAAAGARRVVDVLVRRLDERCPGWVRAGGSRNGE